MTINTAPTNPANATTVRAAGSTSVTNPSSNLDKDGFLKMFVAQMQHQDPSSPQDPNQSTEQMTQFSMLEQITNMASANSKIATSLQTSSAVGLIGRTVTYIGADGVTQTGKVERVATSKDGQASLTIAGKAGVDPSSISEVSA
jgi:flagellar basal-body rod modification protein FlgD